MNVRQYKKRPYFGDKVKPAQEYIDQATWNPQLTDKTVEVEAVVNNREASVESDYGDRV